MRFPFYNPTKVTMAHRRWFLDVETLLAYVGGLVGEKASWRLSSYPSLLLRWMDGVIFFFSGGSGLRERRNLGEGALIGLTEEVG